MEIGITRLPMPFGLLKQPKSTVLNVAKPALVCVDPARVPEIWPHVAVLIDAAYARHGTREERRQVEHDVFARKALLWIAWADKIEGVVITDIVLEDGALICQLRALAGKGLRR